MEIIEYNSEFIEMIINEKKIISVPPKKEMKTSGSHFRNYFELISEDGKRQYQVFIRQHKEFLENFTIGLILQLKDRESFQVIRFNGNHGEAVSSDMPLHPHRDYHIHVISAEDIELNKNEPTLSKTTDKYASFEQALCYFGKYINITDFSSYFKFCSQDTLF
jgi:hypothetical protein